jgi:predicted acylesterase/phospholipase RssA
MPDRKSTAIFKRLRRGHTAACRHVRRCPPGADASGAPCDLPDEERLLPKAEFRIALVMNGGVSLAVWMGGVTHELDLLRRASRGDPADSVPPEERAVFEIWQEVAKEARIEVKVDIISGTSAGGLNGLLLATTIARGSPLPKLRELWLEVASLDELIPEKHFHWKPLLDGHFFEDRVQKALQGMLPGTQPRSERVTLFVTATALDGRYREYEDSIRNAFSLRDHRRMYRFRNDPETFRYGQEGIRWKLKRDTFRDFADTNIKVLARAARATASYPVAFQPVSEHLLLDYRVHPERALDFPASCVMDGGVLNNAPFAPVLDEITARRGGPAERIVMFVVPTGGVLADEAVKKERCENVRIHTTAWNALNYPSEADFRSGIDEVQFRLEISGPRSRDELLTRLLDSDRGREEERDMRVAAKALYAEYRRGRVLAVQKRLAFTNARVTVLKTAEEPLERTLRQVLEQEHLSWLVPSALRTLTEPGLEDWRWGLTPTERLLQNLLYQLHQLLSKAREEENQAWVQALSEAIPLVNDSLLKVLAIHEAVTEKTQWDECPPGPWEEAWKLDKVFKDLSVPSSVGDLVHKAARCFLHTVHFCGRFEHWRRPEDVVAAMLLVEVLTQTFAPPARAIEKLSPEFRFLRLGPDHMGPLFNEDWSVDLGDRKLYGLRCYHFAAFMKEEWRRHDFTWGRLDAAHHLLGLLSGQGCDEKTERELQKAILRAEDGLAREGGEEDPTERMRVRLKKLDELTDDEMLDQGLPRKKQANLLRPLGVWRFLRWPLHRYVKWRRMTRSQRAFWRVVSVVLIIILGVTLWFVLHR